MKLKYTKIELAKKSNRIGKLYLAYNKKEKEFSGNQIVKNKKTKSNWEYPDFEKDYENCTRYNFINIVAEETETTTFFLENEEHPEVELEKDIDVLQALFLNFMDLDLKNPYEVASFIENYGFLLNHSNFEKNIDYGNICRKLYGLYEYINLKNKLKLNKKQIYFEPLADWILLQSRLHGLISLWRYISVTNESPFKKIYEEENFLISQNNKFYKNKTLDNLNDEYFYISDDIEPVKYKQLCNFILSPEINITKQYDSYDVKKLGITGLIQHANFLDHFASDFIQTQIKQILTLFSPGLDVHGYISNQSNKYPFQTNFHCKSLFSLILSQFISAISEKRTFLRCSQCHQWIKKRVSRNLSKYYCGNTCRSNANRLRSRYKQNLDPKIFVDKNYFEKMIDTSFQYQLNERKSSEEGYRIKRPKPLSDLDKLANTIRNCYLFDFSSHRIAYHVGIEEKILGKLKFLEKYKFKSHNINPYKDWDIE